MFTCASGSIICLGCLRERSLEVFNPGSVLLFMQRPVVDQKLDDLLLRQVVAEAEVAERKVVAALRLVAKIVPLAEKAVTVAPLLTVMFDVPNVPVFRPEVVSA